MIVTLQNEYLTVQIDSIGAELTSVRDRNETEFLWQGDPAIWNRRAPLLFPIIARLKDSSYTLNDKTYSIPTHGFCRDAAFKVTGQSGCSVSFQYSDTELTRKVYPFAFVIRVTYTLEGRRLRKSHLVENHSNDPMLYELGGHDGYRVPLEAGAAAADYAIRIPGVEEITPYGMDDKAMITPKSFTYPLTNGRIQLHPATYHLDTVILDSFSQHKAILVDREDRPRITVEFDDFPYLGIWTSAKVSEPRYVCIEPWTTLPDATFVGRGLADKAGIRTLQPGNQETLSYTVTFHEGIL